MFLTDVCRFKKITMIQAIHFKNYRALRDATLPLGRFTLIVGPNNSGKTTAMESLRHVHSHSDAVFHQIANAKLPSNSADSVEVIVEWDSEDFNLRTRKAWSGNSVVGPQYLSQDGVRAPDEQVFIVSAKLDRVRIFALRGRAIAEPVKLQRNVQLGRDGTGLAGVLDNLRDNNPERFESINSELNQWLPEFDRILFDTADDGQRVFMLRTRAEHHKIQATDLSEGTLVMLAFMTLTYLPDPPAIVCFEEPELFLHPRLLREIQDGMYRLCYPEDYGDDRKPVQVIATTHSPYLLDLYKEHPEEIVIAEKNEQGTRFERLSDKTDVSEFLQGAPLGEVWFSGVLGGVPAGT